MSDRTVRSLAHDIQIEVRDTDLMPERAAQLLARATARKTSNCRRVMACWFSLSIRSEHTTGPYRTFSTVCKGDPRLASCLLRLRPAVSARRPTMIFQQFLYPQTGCAAYVFG